MNSTPSFPKAVALCLVALSAALAANASAVPPSPSTYFHWFEYSGHDRVFETPLPPGSYRNPVLAGPLILGRGQAIAYVASAPGVRPESAVVEPEPTPTTGNFTWRDDFDSPFLKPEWLQVRVPKQPWVDLSSRPGWLTIHPLTAGLDSLTNPSFLARRQQHLSFDATTELEVPKSPGVAAGLAAFQSESYWYFLGVRRGAPGSRAPLDLFLEKRCGARTDTIARLRLEEGIRLMLRISGNARAYSFYYDEDDSGWKPMVKGDDGSILSTAVAGGFVGAVVGPYARAE
jgi:xylan 1,4-beta-xylosidase